MSPGTGPRPDARPQRRSVDDELLIRNLLDHAQEVIYFKDLEHRFLRVSLGCAELHGRTQEGMLGLTDEDLFDTSHAAKAAADEARVARTGEPLLNAVERERWEDRPDSWVSSSKFPLRDLDGTIIGTFGISRDVTRRVEVEQELVRLAAAAEEAKAESGRIEAQLRSVLAGSADAICLYDHDLRLRYANPAAETLRGRSVDELVGCTDAELGHPAEGWEQTLGRVLTTGRPEEVEHSEGEDRWFHTSVTPERDAAGAVTGVVTSTRDISELKRAERVLAHQALHDSVTGLPNRYLLMDRLEHALVRLERAPGRVGLFFVDLDHFKDVNDVYGHDVGDRVLVELARRLQTAARREDTVARLGGDEFVVLCERVGCDDDVQEIADRIVRQLAEPLVHGGATIRLSASVGATATDDPTASPEELLRGADHAMYRAKQGGRNQFHVHDPAEDEDPAVRLAIDAELGRALEQDELRLVYQPLLSLSDHSVLGFEALLRWQHPDRGLLSPQDFLEHAERSRLIVPIGAWVLDRACAQLAAWSTDGDLTMAVNVSGHQLHDPAFPALVEQALTRYGLAADRLRVEIAERVLAQATGTAADVLDRLVALGVQLAVDDFGTTVSSLARLPQIPVSVVKLDRFADVSRERPLVAAVIAVAHGLGMSVVGGGIENDVQLAELSDLACDDGQGFLLGPPLDEDAAAALLTGRTSSVPGSS